MFKSKTFGYYRNDLSVFSSEQVWNYFLVIHAFYDNRTVARISSQLWSYFPFSRTDTIFLTSTVLPGPCRIGHDFANFDASSKSLALTVMKPAIDSLISANGPSVTM